MYLLTIFVSAKLIALIYLYLRKVMQACDKSNAAENGVIEAEEPTIDLSSVQHGICEQCGDLYKVNKWISGRSQKNAAVFTLRQAYPWLQCEPYGVDMANASEIFNQLMSVVGLALENKRTDAEILVAWNDATISLAGIYSPVGNSTIH